MSQEPRGVEPQYRLQSINSGRIVLQFQIALAKAQQGLHVIRFECEGAFKCIPGVLPFGELHIHCGQQSQGGHIVGLEFDCPRGMLRGPRKIHQFVVGRGDVVINARQRSIRTLCLKQPLQSGPTVPRAA